MLRKLRERIESEEKGFTLIELLVVMLIIGILAAIALPIFLNQQDKGRDASAKSDARNLVSHVESCVADNPANGYADCNTAGKLGTTGLAVIGDGATVPADPADRGKVAVTATNGTDSFTVVALSKSGVFYAISKNNPNGTVQRTCGTEMTAAGVAGGTLTKGGCKSGSW